MLSIRRSQKGNSPVIGVVLLFFAADDLGDFPDDATQHLVSLIKSSDDAIISKDLNGIIRSWNPGATRVFGYTEDEAIGQSIKMLIPQDLQAEEDMILAKIRRGERVAHYHAVRRHKNGQNIHVSLTISPIHNRFGEIVGASKIARDITRQKLVELELEQQRQARELLLEEIQHRVKNTLATVLAVAGQTFKGAPRAEHATFSARMQALSAAHSLLTQTSINRTTLRAVVDEAIAPFQEKGRRRVSVSGEDVELEASRALTLSMILHELGTNAVKYGALSQDTGHVDVHWVIKGEGKPFACLTWQERGGPPVHPPQRKGFGSKLIERALRGTQGHARLDFNPEGLKCTIEILFIAPPGGEVAREEPGARRALS